MFDPGPCTGAFVTAHGSGFIPGEEITLLRDGVPIGTVNAAADGTFEQRVDLEGVDFGTHVVTATGSQSDFVASEEFETQAQVCESGSTTRPDDHRRRHRAGQHRLPDRAAARHRGSGDVRRRRLCWSPPAAARSASMAARPVRSTGSPFARSPQPRHRIWCRGCSVFGSGLRIVADTSARQLRTLLAQPSGCRRDRKRHSRPLQRSRMTRTVAAVETPRPVNRSGSISGAAGGFGGGMPRAAGRRTRPARLHRRRTRTWGSRCS